MKIDHQHIADIQTIVDAMSGNEISPNLARAFAGSLAFIADEIKKDTFPLISPPADQIP